MKLLKWAAIVLAGILVAALAAVAVLVATFDANRYRDDLVRLVQARTGRTLAIDGKIGLALFPRLALSAAGVRLSGPDGRSEFAAVDEVGLALEVLPLLHGELRVDRVRALRPVVHYVRDAKGRSSIDGLGLPAGSGVGEEAEAGGKGGEAIRFDIQGIELVDGRFALDDAVSGRRGEISGVSFTLGHFAAGRPAPLSLVGRFDFAAPPARGKLALKGTLAMEGGTTALRDLHLELALSPAAGEARALELVADGSVTHDAAAATTVLALSGTLDGGKFEASAKAAKDAPLRFDLQAAKLDTDRLLAAVAGAKEPAAGPERGAAKAETGGTGDAKRVDLSFARGLKLDGRVRVGELRAAGLTLAGLDATLRGDGHALSIAPLSARGYGGRVDGSVRIDGDDNALAAKQNFADLDVGRLLHDLAHKDVIDGRGSLRLDVATRGATVGALKAALAGSAVLAVRDGAVKGIDIGRLLREGQALVGGRRDAEQVFHGSEKTDFSALDATFRIVRGVARNDDLSAKSPLLRLAGAGTIDIPRNRLDYLLRASVVNTTQGQGGAELAELRGLTVPVRIAGPIEAPVSRVLWSEVAAGVAQRALAEKLQRSLGGQAPKTPEDAAKKELGQRLLELLH